MRCPTRCSPTTKRKSETTAPRSNPMEHPEKQCKHPEAHVNGLVDEEGNVYSAHVLGHNCEYVEARNVLIPFAEVKANKAVGRKGPVVGHHVPRADEIHAAYVRDWNQVFF